ncbi:MAG: FAD-dependent urate hydroxylase HpxO [Leptolyngbyaceae cyanobacterium bins.302]|nr:FAD-dependent urate hydroxylase HpxO [Leptolyngbyaceae cyanobacterium bins.302]
MDSLKVIIVGAGIGGLTAGIAMAKAGYEIEIYDRVSDLRPAGAGISLWSNGVKVLNRLGLGKEIAAIGGQMDRMEYRTVAGEVLNHIDLLPLMHQVGQRPYPVARTDLQQMLRNAFPGEVKLDHACVEIRQDEHQVTAIFENGHEATGDVLIAANGIRSNCRAYVAGEEVPPKYVGYVNWNGLVPASADLAPPNTWVVYVGEHKRASMMPVADDRFYFFFDVPMPQEAAFQGGDIRADLTRFFAGWAPPVQTLIQQLDPEKTNRVPIHDMGPIDRMVRGRVALLGDAAHTTCPDLGQGGCQALEDALVLTNYLTSTNISVADALKRYEAERVERTCAVVQKARKRAEQIHGKDPAITQQWYEQLAQEKPAAVRDAIAKVILAGPLK